MQLRQGYRRAVVHLWCMVGLVLVATSSVLPIATAKSPQLLAVVSPPTTTRRRKQQQKEQQKQQQQPLKQGQLVAFQQRRIRNDKVLADPAWLVGLKNALASGLAAACSKIILAPFDTIKTLQQHSRSSASANPLTLIEAAQVILKRPKGFLELYVS